MKNTEFIPDYNNILQVLYNRKPKRLPLYEHHIDLPFINKMIRKGNRFTGHTGKGL